MGDASVTSVTEYLLTQPILSFTVSSCAALQVGGDNDEFSGEESGEEDGTYASAKKSLSSFDSRRNDVLLKLHCVHTK